MAPLRALVLTIVLSAMAATTGSAVWATGRAGTRLVAPSTTTFVPSAPRRPDGQLRTAHPSEVVVIPNRNEGSATGRLILLSLALVFVVVTIERRRTPRKRRRIPFREIAPLALCLRAPPTALTPSFSR